MGRERESYNDVRGPESEIVPEKLHNQCTVLVGFLTQCIQFRNSLIESLTYQGKILSRCEKPQMKTKTICQLHSPKREPISINAVQSSTPA